MSFKFQWSETMDTRFERFQRRMGAAFVSQEVPLQALEHYEGILPTNLLAYWERHGWCGYNNGLYWTVNPNDYRDIIERLCALSQLDDPSETYVIARGAFGNLEIWNSKRGNVMSYYPVIGLLHQWHAEEMPEQSEEELELDMALFFESASSYRHEQVDEYEEPLFERALDKLGPLAENEMYAFVPATCLGGKWLLENLQKVDITTHLEMLMDLEEPRIDILR
ncbi:GAD-like domain-containing protein [Vibrio rotiferianus]|uniref:GAD-like domain-containing protein n=1 Tax=Vibrio rotiferianus TaxID=190895 RepID=UPI000237814D|nr:GAD-like domain-containing protein [Vibrio rotiferianus]